MKSHYLTGLLLFLFWGSNAQTSIQPGFRAGANFSQITRTYYEPRTDFYFGAFGEIKLSDLFRLQPEIGYSRQGAKGDVYLLQEPGGPEPYEGKVWYRKNVEANYVTVGVTGKLAFSEAVRLLFGLSAEQGLEVVEPLRNDIDLSVLAGAEYKFPFGLGVEVRLKRGAIDKIDSQKYETFSSGKSWMTVDWNVNMVIQAGLTYSLGR